MSLCMSLSLALGKAPEPPGSFTASVLNSTSVRLTWTHPLMTQPLNTFTAVANYSITHERVTVVVRNSTTMFDYGGVAEGGVAMFGIAASNSFGISDRVYVSVTLPSITPDPTTSSPTTSSKLLSMVYIVRTSCDGPLNRDILYFEYDTTKTFLRGFKSCLYACN